MIAKSNLSDGLAQNNDEIFVRWNNSYLIGIEIIDDQHKVLVELTNELYRACMHGGQELDIIFKDTMSRMVDYVKFHFGFEQNMLLRVKYPKYAEHKAEHDGLIKTVLEATKSYGDNKRFVPNNFVRFLRDWIISHIGHIDKVYAAYIAEQMQKGLVTEKDILGT